MFDTSPGSLIVQILQRSPYTPFLACVVKEVEVKVDETRFLFKIDPEGRFSLKVLPDDHPKASATVKTTLPSLQEAVEKNWPVKDCSANCVTSHDVHPRVGELLLRCFSWVGEFPGEDREWLIYAALFGFDEPTVVWQTENQALKVLEYPQPDGTKVRVSAGLTNPGSGPEITIYEPPLSGLGYELALKSDNDQVLNEFTHWLTYLANTGNHIQPGNWLEYPNQGLIANTNFAGFLIDSAQTIPCGFPVVNGTAYWHVFVPVDLESLERAKATNAYEVLDSLDTIRL